ncbi:hypothetical protein HDU81_004884 [Chytriomyces hyalinus]|nr:hypothetical protein HDU81_004884 [Chytriomyces hyalinus]
MSTVMRRFSTRIGAARPWTPQTRRQTSLTSGTMRSLPNPGGLITPAEQALRNTEALSLIVRVCGLVASASALWALRSEKRIDDAEHQRRANEADQTEEGHRSWTALLARDGVHSQHLWVAFVDLLSNVKQRNLVSVNDLTMLLKSIARDGTSMAPAQTLYILQFMASRNFVLSENSEAWGHIVGACAQSPVYLRKIIRLLRPSYPSVHKDLILQACASNRIDTADFIFSEAFAAADSNENIDILAVSKSYLRALVSRSLTENTSRLVKQMQGIPGLSKSDASTLLITEILSLNKVDEKLLHLAVDHSILMQESSVSQHDHLVTDFISHLERVPRITNGEKIQALLKYWALNDTLSESLRSRVIRLQTKHAPMLSAPKLKKMIRLGAMRGDSALVQNLWASRNKLDPITPQYRSTGGLSSLLTAESIAGNSTNAVQLFSQLASQEVPTSAMCQSLIHNLYNNKMPSEARKIYQYQLSNNIHRRPATITRILTEAQSNDAFTSVATPQRIVEDYQQTKQDELSIASKPKKSHQRAKTLNSRTTPTSHTLTLLIKSFIQFNTSNLSECIPYLANLRIKFPSTPVDAQVYNVLLNACIRHSAFSVMMQLREDMSQHNVKPDIATFTLLIRHASRSGDISHVYALLDEMSQLGISVSWKIGGEVVRALCNMGLSVREGQNHSLPRVVKSSEQQEALFSLWKVLLKTGFIPDGDVVVLSLKTLLRWERGRGCNAALKLWALLKEYGGFGVDASGGKILLDALERSGELSKSQEERIYLSRIGVDVD